MSENHDVELFHEKSITVKNKKLWKNGEKVEFQAIFLHT